MIDSSHHLLICISIKHNKINPKGLFPWLHAPTRLTYIKDGFRLMKPYKMKPHVNIATVSPGIYSNYMYTIHPNLIICFGLWLVTKQVTNHVTQQPHLDMWILKIKKTTLDTQMSRKIISIKHHMASTVPIHPAASSRLTEFQYGFLPQTPHQVAKPLVNLIKTQQKYI